MSWTNEQIQAVWEKGKIVKPNDPNVYRQDECDAWIKRDRHGNRNSNVGWEIDHIKPEADGGSDDIGNLRPLQWENNVSKSDGRLICVVTASGNENVKIK